MWMFETFYGEYVKLQEKNSFQVMIVFLVFRFWFLIVVLILPQILGFEKTWMEILDFSF